MGGMHVFRSIKNIFYDYATFFPFSQQKEALRSGINPVRSAYIMPWDHFTPNISSA